MATALAVEQMNTVEKLEAMELLWASLSADEDSVPSPAWHGEVLQKRRAAVAEGSESYQDWEQAKREIRAAIS
ncbi:MAG: hypothetical protein ACI8W8_002469 [Rhodothermales bacterium]|jgi:hypothetical protein